MSQFENYYGYVGEEADSIVSEYKQEAIELVLDGGSYDDLCQFFQDSRVHEWADNDFIYVDLLDSAQILDQSDEVETDSGLWEGQEPREAIKTQAFFTYRRDLEITVIEKMESELQNERERLEIKLGEEQNALEHLDEESDEYEEQEEKIADIEQQIEYVDDVLSDF